MDKSIVKSSPIYQTFHGQSREDEIAWQLFKDSPSGYFVDIGAHDGLHLSNTYAFERRGWRGMCIEPHPKYYRQLVTNRPGSLCLNAAVSNHLSHGMPFMATEKGIFSSLSAKDIARMKSLYPPDGFENTEQVIVPLITLDYALAIHGVERVDYLSVDVEGREMDVLAGFDITRWQPRLVIVENNNLWDALMGYFSAAGYQLARVVYQNMFFVRGDEDAGVIKGL